MRHTAKALIRRKQKVRAGNSEQVGIPYQSLINLYLRDCAA